MGQTIEKLCVVDSVSKKETHKTDVDKEEHTLVVVNKDTAFKASITQPDPFLGYHAGDPVTVVLKRDQTTLDETKKGKK